MDRQIEELRDGYPWENIKQGNVVDMGGGSGHISVALLRVSLEQYQDALLHD